MKTSANIEYKEVVPADVTVVYEDESILTPFRTQPILSVGNVAEDHTGTWAQLSEHHGRALVDTRLLGKTVWGDTNGITFGALDLKGSIADSIEIEKTPSGELRISGLKSETSIRRIAAVSKYLRENGLPTEGINNIYQINSLPISGEQISVEDWKKREIERRLLEIANLGDIADKTDKGSGDYINTSRDKVDRTVELERIRPYLQDLDLYIIERSLQTAERIRDIKVTKTREDFINGAANGILWVAKGIKHGYYKSFAERLLTDEEDFDIENPDHLKKYFVDWLPSQMGAYLAKFHKLGLVHGFTHSQNWSLAGTLYDLDSVRGYDLDESLGISRPPPAKEDQVTDVKKSLNGIFDIYTTRNIFNEILDLRGDNYIAQQIKLYSPEEPAIAVQGLSNFIASYIREMYGDQVSADNTELASIINKLYPDTVFVGHIKESVDFIRESVIELTINKIRPKAATLGKT